MRSSGAGSLHALPPLPYAHAALEPHVDARTMTLHHGKHHASYVDNLNAALADCPALQHRSALWLLLNAGEIPVAVRTAVRNNAGGHLNHSLFWRAMSPGGGEPAGALADAIKRDFGSFPQFKARFADAGNRVFGAGWVWLTRAQTDGGKLQVHTTSGHENPLTQGHFPVLVNDVWEHAYYLKHENRRLDYLNAWWAIADWNEAARRYQMSGNAAALQSENEAGRTLTPA